MPVCLRIWSKAFKLMEWKASAKTGERGGISIFQSTTDKFMVVLYRSLYLPDTGYGIPTGYQISGRISGRSGYPVQPYSLGMISMSSIQHCMTLSWWSLWIQFNIAWLFRDGLHEFNSTLHDSFAMVSVRKYQEIWYLYSVRLLDCWN